MLMELDTKQAVAMLIENIDKVPVSTWLVHMVEMYVCACFDDLLEGTCKARFLDVNCKLYVPNEMCKLNRIDILMHPLRQAIILTLSVWVMRKDKVKCSLNCHIRL